MKKLVLALCLFAAAGAVHAQEVQQAAATAKVDPAKAPKFKFESDVHDFGTIKEGPQAKYVFEFKNVGKTPLIIQNANASCGCTTPEWPKEPIAPGKKGTITVIYNTQGRVAPFEKSVWVTSNAALPEGKDRYELKIKGTVVAGATAATDAK